MLIDQALSLISSTHFRSCLCVLLLLDSVHLSCEKFHLSHSYKPHCSFQFRVLVCTYHKIYLSDCGMSNSSWCFRGIAFGHSLQDYQQSFLNKLIQESINIIIIVFFTYCNINKVLIKKFLLKCYIDIFSTCTRF